MILTGTIYTTNKKSFIVQSLGAIVGFIKKAKGLTVGDINVISVDLDSAPTVIKTRNGISYVDVDWDWFIKTFPANGNFSCLHISRKDRDRIGFTHSNGKSKLGGRYNRNIGDTSMEFIVIADNVTDFIRIFLHELSHGFSHWTGVKDLTHAFEDLGNYIGNLYQTYDFTKWNLLKSLANALTKQYNLLVKKKTIK